MEFARAGVVNHCFGSHICVRSLTYSQRGEEFKEHQVARVEDKSSFQLALSADDAAAYQRVAHVCTATCQNVFFHDCRVLHGDCLKYQSFTIFPTQ